MNLSHLPHSGRLLREKIRFKVSWLCFENTNFYIWHGLSLLAANSPITYPPDTATSFYHPQRLLLNYTQDTHIILSFTLEIDLWLELALAVELANTLSFCHFISLLSWVFSLALRRKPLSRPSYSSVLTPVLAIVMCWKLPVTCIHMRQAAFVIMRYPRVFCWMRTIAVGIEWQAVYCNLTLHVHYEWLLAVLINAGSFCPISQSLTQPLTQSILQRHFIANLPSWKQRLVYGTWPLCPNMGIYYMYLNPGHVHPHIVIHSLNAVGMHWHSFLIRITSHCRWI